MLTGTMSSNRRTSGSLPIWSMTWEKGGTMLPTATTSNMNAIKIDLSWPSSARPKRPMAAFRQGVISTMWILPIRHPPNQSVRVPDSHDSELT